MGLACPALVKTRAPEVREIADTVLTMKDARGVEGEHGLKIKPHAQMAAIRVDF